MTTFRYFTTEKIDGATIARPVDPYLQGSALAELVKLELMQIIDSSDSTLAIVDFANVKLISSSVISGLLSVKRHLTAANISFKLCGMSDSLRHVFRTLNMDGTIFTIVDTVDDALGSMSKKTYYDVCGLLSPPDEEAP